MAVELFKGTFGVETVQGKNGMVGVDELLKDKKAIGLYFSAHWCPPCRGFTPVLIEFYNNMKGNNQSLEIIFVSSDRDQSSFDGYYSDMPWHAVSFENRDAKNVISEKYGVRGIPTFIILDSAGQIKDANGRATVQAAGGAGKLPDNWV